jgi:hypothetical protein
MQTDVSGDHLVPQEPPGTLVGVIVPESGGFIYVPYRENDGWTNNFGKDLTLRFFINDHPGGYGDNIGTMDCDIVVI